VSTQNQRTKSPNRKLLNHISWTKRKPNEEESVALTVDPGMQGHVVAVGLSDCLLQRVEPRVLVVVRLRPGLETAGKEDGTIAAYLGMAKNTF
jgi:hypothetical protein